MAAQYVNNLTQTPWAYGAPPPEVVAEARQQGLAVGKGPTGTVVPRRLERVWPTDGHKDHLWFTRANSATGLVLGPHPVVGPAGRHWPQWFTSFHQRGAAIAGDTVITFDPFGPRPGYTLRPLPPVPAKPDRLVILVYNAFFLDGFLATDVAQRGPALVDYLLSGAKRWDLLVLAELFHEPTLKKVREALAETFPYASTVVGRTRVRIGTGGLVVFSRWPILVEDEVIFRSCTDTDCGASKGARYVRVQKGNRTYHVIGTHLQAHPGARADRIRLQQAQQLATLAVSQNIPPNEPLIYAGDFNIDQIVPGSRGSGQTALENLLRATPVAAPSAGPCRYNYDPKTNPTAEPHYGVGYPDQALVSRHLPARSVSGVMEYPVVSTNPKGPRYRLLDSCTSDRGGALDVSDHYAMTFTLDFADR